MKIRNELSIYIHIPFCVKKCNYCDFLSFSTTEETRASYIDALCNEISFYGKRDNPEVVTIYIGGGTPSLLNGEQISRILNKVKENFNVSTNAEITMEVNPGALSKESLILYKKAGINRLSIGLQSTNDHELKLLGRIHTYEDFLKNYQAAREVGFDNISVDLMSALPEQTLEEYCKSLIRVATLRPEHISTYSLILEEGTLFYKDNTIESRLPDEELEREMYYKTRTILQQYGYNRYEISNYSRQGKESRHNVGYWIGREYLGLGLGAASYYEGARFLNIRELPNYLSQWNQMGLSFIDRIREYHIVTEQESMEEMIFLGLRMMAGISIYEFKERFSRDIYDIYGNILEKLEKEKLILINQGQIMLTDKGIDVSNYVMSEFIL